MFELYIYLVIFYNYFVQVEANIYNHSQIDLTKCKIHYSRSGSVYRDFYSITESPSANDTLLLDFHFAVLAPSDAHILLAPSDRVKKGDPAYEIVIGAGGNTFSDIRRKQKSEVKASVRVKGLLNALDPQFFWLHITKDGDIAVGKETEELPFISWIDPDPLPLKVISFSTWSGVEAKWYFDCEKINKTQEIQRPLTSLEKLRRDLLYHYDPYVRPVKNFSTLTNISMALDINHITLDEHRATMEILGQIFLVWQDEKLVWDPEKYEGLKSFHIFRREIWQPDLVLYNAIGDARDLTEDTLMVALYTGYVKWNPKTEFKVFCDSNDLGTWPKDNHKCNVILGFMRDFNQMRLTFRRNDSLLTLQDSSEWTVLEADVISALAFNENNQTSEPAIFEIIFTLKRSSDIYEWMFFAPFLFLSVSILLTFWVDPFGKLKLSMVCSQMVVCTGVLLILALIVPHHVKRTPFLVALYSYTLVAGLIAIIISIIVINLSRNNHKKSLPHVFCKILTSPVLKYGLCLPNIKMADKYGNLNEKSEESQAMWILFGVFIDRITFLIYLGLALYAVVINHQ